jgi:hypothetical protein
MEVEQEEKTLTALESKKVTILIINEYVTEVTTIDDKMTFDEAREYASSLGSNWRLPTVGELMLIYRIPPKGVHLPDTNMYWSMDEHPKEGDVIAKAVGMKFGFSYYKYKHMPFSVCFVRYETNEQMEIIRVKKNENPALIRVYRMGEDSNQSPKYPIDPKRVPKDTEEL